MRKAEEKKSVPKTTREAFLDNTLRRVIIIIEDTIFNERTARKRGLLQSINPVLKIASFLTFIILIAIQRSPSSVMPYSTLAIILILLSRLSPWFIIKKISPIIFFTSLIALPASLNIIVEGRDALVLYVSKARPSLFGINLPQKISITKEGIISMFGLIMRVTTSVLFVFLLTMTTRSDRLLKSLMFIVPKLYRSIIGITYRYTFFLVRKVEDSIRGLESRRIRPIGSSKGRRWVASRIGLLFSISIELSRELSIAMESRGFSEDSKQDTKAVLNFTSIDAFWLFFFLFFNGLVIWKFLK